MNVRALRRLQDALPNDPLLLTTATTLKDLDSFRLTLWNSVTGFAITLPKATGSGKMYYLGIGKTATGGSHTVVTASGDFIAGNIFEGVVGGTTGQPFLANGTSHTTLSFNGGSTGGTKGDIVIYHDALSGVWFIRGSIIGTSVSNPIS